MFPNSGASGGRPRPEVYAQAQVDSSKTKVPITMSPKNEDDRLEFHNLRQGTEGCKSVLARCTQGAAGSTSFEPPASRGRAPGTKVSMPPSEVPSRCQLRPSGGVQPRHVWSMVALPAEAFEALLKPLRLLWPPPRGCALGCCCCRDECMCSLTKMPTVTFTHRIAEPERLNIVYDNWKFL